MSDVGAWWGVQGGAAGWKSAPWIREALGGFHAAVGALVYLHDRIMIPISNVHPPFMSHVCFIIVSFDVPDLICRIRINSLLGNVISNIPLQSELGRIIFSKQYDARAFVRHSIPAPLVALES